MQLPSEALTGAVSRRNPFCDAEPWPISLGLSQGRSTASTDVDIRPRLDFDSTVGDGLRYMDGLLADFARGALVPVPVSLPNVPADAPLAVMKVVGDVELLLGLRLAVGDTRPLPYACRWRTSALGLNYRTVNRILLTLVETGALIRDEPMPGRAARGTLTFRAPGAECEARHIGVEPQDTSGDVVVQPAGAHADERGNADRLLKWALRDAQIGTRNHVGFKLACQLRDNGVEQAVADAVLAEYQRRVPQGRPRDAYTLREAWASVDQAYRREPREPWSGGGSPTGRLDSRTVWS